MPFSRTLVRMLTQNLSRSWTRLTDSPSYDNICHTTRTPHFLYYPPSRTAPDGPSNGDESLSFLFNVFIWLAHIFLSPSHLPPPQLILNRLPWTREGIFATHRFCEKKAILKWFNPFYHFFLYTVQISRKTKTNSLTEAKVVSVSSFLELSVDKQL